jgi:hypothetical protein
MRDDLRVAVGGSQAGLGEDRSYRNVSVRRALGIREVFARRRTLAGDTELGPVGLHSIGLQTFFRRSFAKGQSRTVHMELSLHSRLVKFRVLSEVARWKARWSCK